MARTKKVGITGRFGARYGRKAKRSVKITGGAYVPETPMAKSAARSIRDIRVEE